MNFTFDLDNFFTMSNMFIASALIFSSGIVLALNCRKFRLLVSHPIAVVIEIFAVIILAIHHLFV